MSTDDTLSFETGGHYCAIFNSDEEWRQCVRALTRYALDHNHRFLYLYHSHTPEEIMSCLADLNGVSVAVDAGQVQLLPAMDCYCPNGVFDPELIPRTLPDTVQQTLDDGYGGLVATGEVSSVVQEGIPGLERFLEYEALLEDALTGQPFACLCQYDRRISSAEYINEALLVHQRILCGGRILPNHYYVPPRHYLSPNRAEGALSAHLQALLRAGEAEASLRSSEERYRTVADHAYDWEYLYARDGKLLYMSPSCERITGHTAAEFRADDSLFHRIVHPDDVQSVRDHIEACRCSDSMGEFEFRIIRRDGEVRWISHVCRAVRTESGEKLGRRSTNRDITDRKLERLERERLTAELTASQRQLAASEELYRSIGELIPFGVWVCDPDGTPTYVSESYLEMMGLTLEELQTDTARHPLFGRGTNMLEHWHRHATGGVWDRECDVIGKDGTTYRILARGIPLFTQDGALRCWAGSSLDITHRRREQEELQRHRDYLEDLVGQRTAELVEHRERLRLMTSQLALAEEQERRRIATAIHDDLSQTLAFAKMRLATLQKERDPEALQAGHTDLLTLMDDAIGAARTLTLELSPPVLYQMGFEPALRWLGAHMAKAHGYRVVVHIDKKPKPLGSDAELTLFQSAREMLTNAAKYASCTTVEMCLHRRGDVVQLSIRDDGRGFDPAKVKTTVSSGFGLFSIRERLTYLGGELQIESARGQGCRLDLRVPVNEQ